MDLTGKTVMPALVNTHAHYGYEKYLKAEGESRAENFTADNLRDHLQREAYLGTGSVLDGGSGALAVTQPFQAAQAAGSVVPAARLNLMGGVVPVNGGPDHILIQGTRPLKANYEVTLSSEARAAIRDLNAKGLKHVKIWLGDRNGTYPAMPHEVYDAVIDEAHKAGLKVHAHATNGRDQKDALRAGVDVLVHTVQNAPIDDELASLLKEKRPYWTTVFGLGDRSEVCERNPFVVQVLSAAIVADVLATDCKPNPNLQVREERLKQNFMKMIASGARLVLGTDAGVWPRYSFGTVRPPRTAALRRVRAHASAGNRRGDFTPGGSDRHSGCGRARAGEAGRLHRPRRESARGHQEHAADQPRYWVGHSLTGMPCWPAGRTAPGHRRGNVVSDAEPCVSRIQGDNRPHD